MISGSSSTIRTRLDTLAVYLTNSRANHSLVTSRSSRAPPSRCRESAKIGATVEPDVEAGAVRLLAYAAVHDCGRPINPMVVEGQVHGRIAQGIGAGLQEELMYDEAGQLLTATLMDYALPRADQVPPLGVEHLEHASAANALGIKGVGESGVIAPGPAIAGAVEDALAEYGVTVARIPLTPARVSELLRSARRRHS